MHVGHLTQNTSKEVLHEIFTSYGRVTNIELPVDRSNGVTLRGFAYVEFSTAAEAEEAVQCMNGGKLIVQKNTYFYNYLFVTSYKT